MAATSAATTAGERLADAVGKMVSAAMVVFASASSGEDGAVGGGSNGGGQRFSKFLDDFRVYSIAMDQADVDILYNNGNGDIGPEASLASAPVLSGANSVSLTLDFKRDGSNVAVTGLTASDFQVTNGTVSGLTRAICARGPAR